MNNEAERWRSLKEVMTHLGVSHDTILTWSAKCTCLHCRSTGIGNLKHTRKTPL